MEFLLLQDGDKLYMLRGRILADDAILDATLVLIFLYSNLEVGFKSCGFKQGL